jgi:hypothetical protein
VRARHSGKLRHAPLRLLFFNPIIVAIRRIGAALYGDDVQGCGSAAAAEGG